MPAAGDIVASVSAAPPETEILQVGRDLAAALPGTARHPIKVLDERAMELASQDAELRAALFRFVDVVPACRDLDDLARHLTSFLDEVDDRPPPLAVAMRMGATRAGRTALGAAAAAGVKHMAHRFIVGETPHDATGILEDLWRDGVGTSVDLLGEATVTAAEADRYAGRCHDALDELHEVYRRLPPRPHL
jgi:proline dehydrogenase